MSCLRMSFYMLACACCGSVAAGSPVDTTPTPFPLPAVFSSAIDSDRYGDEPQLIYTAGPGGMAPWLNLPSRIEFVGTLENLNDYGFNMDLNLGVEILPGDHAHIFSLGQLTMPGTPPGSSPVPIPIQLSLSLPDSYPIALSYFEVDNYINHPGMHLQGELRYTIGVPEPSTVQLAWLSAATVLAIRWRRSHHRCRRRPQSRSAALT